MRNKKKDETERNHFSFDRSSIRKLFPMCTSILYKFSLDSEQEKIIIKIYKGR
jgi:hypothetical protein